MSWAEAKCWWFMESPLSLLEAESVSGKGSNAFQKNFIILQRERQQVLTFFLNPKKEGIPAIWPLTAPDPEQIWKNGNFKYTKKRDRFLHILTFVPKFYRAFGNIIR